MNELTIPEILSTLLLEEITREMVVEFLRKTKRVLTATDKQKLQTAGF